MYIYIYKWISDIVYPIWKHTHKGPPPTNPTPCRGRHRQGPGAWVGVGWGGIAYGSFPYWIKDIGYLFIYIYVYIIYTYIYIYTCILV